MLRQGSGQVSGRGATPQAAGCEAAWQVISPSAPARRQQPLLCWTPQPQLAWPAAPPGSAGRHPPGMRSSKISARGQADVTVRPAAAAGGWVEGRLGAHGGPCRCSQGTSKVPHDRSQRTGTGVRAVRPVGGVTAPRPRLLAPAAPQPAVIWARTLTTRTPMPLDAHKRPCGAEVYRWCSGRMLAGLAGLLMVLLGGSRAQRARQQRRRSLRLGRIRACSRYDLLLRPLQGFSAHPSPPEHLIS